MKRTSLVLLVIACLLLNGCSDASVSPGTDTATVTPTQTTVPPTEFATVPTETTSPAETELPYTSFTIAGVSVEDVILYFNEVCLNAEFVNSGNPSFLQRWAEPIHYTLTGSPTTEDLSVLESFTHWLNTIEGFPGISEAADAASVNMRIHFCSESELISFLGDQFYGTDGGVTFWYHHNEIYDATICIRTDLDQQLRNSVILEELYNSLGPIQDTALRQDSIIYSDFSQPQQLTQIDELLIKLLYHPQMQCGMDAAACEAVIRQLYH